MSILRFFRALKPTRRDRRANASTKFTPRVNNLESRITPNGYLAVGAGPGSFPWVAIRVDIKDALGGNALNTLGQPAPARSDGKSDYTSQIFMPFMSGFRGGVKTAAGNFDGLYSTPDSLVTAAGPGGGPHVIIWNTRQLNDGSIVTDGIRDQFFAFDPRFRGGVNVATGDLDGDGKAELICGAGAGGGPHVKIYSDVNGKFQLVNEFFAFEAGFRGGVNVASGQGYQTTVQQRLTVTNLPQREVPYEFPQLAPGSRDGIPLMDADQNGAYITVGSGPIGYLSANMLGSWTNIGYRPNIYFPPNAPNPAGIGQVVYALWETGDPNLPPGFDAEVVYGPFIRVSANRVVRMTSPRDTLDTEIVGNVEVSDALTTRNHLVVGAGAGGGPHVKIYGFETRADGSLQEHMGKDFFAFDPSFRGGVNVAIGDVISHTSSGNVPGRFDYISPTRDFIRDTDRNSGSQAFISFPYDTALYEKFKPEIICAMASLGSEVRVYGDSAEYTFDPFSDRSDAIPARRTDLSQLNLVPYTIDASLNIDPNANALTNFSSIQSTTTFRRAVDGLFSGGIVPAVTAFTFGSHIGNPLLVGTVDGLMETNFYGFNQVNGSGTAIASNPVLGKVFFGAGPTPVGQPNQGSRIRSFNQMGPFRFNEEEYRANEDFQAFPDISVRGASPAFGFGVLPEDAIDVVRVNYAAGINGAANNNAINNFSPATLTNPILDS
jgi:hypothetical protein